MTFQTADDGARTVLDFFGIPNDGSQGIWCIDCDGELNWYSGMDCAEQYIRIGRHDFKMSRQFVDDDYENILFFDNIEQAKKVANGVNVVVYDKITESIADSIGFRKKR